MDDVEEEFEKIALDATDKAASVICSAAEYQEGLRGFIETLKVDLQASEERD